MKGGRLQWTEEKLEGWELEALSVENASKSLGPEGKGREHSVEQGDCRMGETKDSYISSRMKP